MLQLPEQLLSVVAEVCAAAQAAVAQLAAQIPQLQPLWDAISGVITEVCTALGVA